jgi:hypothetical protein
MKIMIRILRFAAIVSLFLAFQFNTSAQCHGGGGGGSSSGHSGHSGHSADAGKQDNNSQQLYTCPMHPEIVSHAQGTCPKCGMTLEKKKTSFEKKTEEKVYFYCSEHPSNISDKKGKCNVCGKKLKKAKSYTYE